MIKNKINGKIYIGQTTRSVEERLEEHRRKKRCIGIYNAIKKYGWKNFEKDWYECPNEDLNFDEELLVQEMETLTPNGYNLMEGGGSCGKRSKKTKQRMREARLGTKNPMYGIIGEKSPMYGTTGEKSPRSKRVYQYDLDGTFIDSFGSCREAGRQLKKDKSSIGKCASGNTRRKTAYNFKWSYNLDIFM